jgi:hypothetical protein
MATSILQQTAASDKTLGDSSRGNLQQNTPEAQKIEGKLFP